MHLLINLDHWKLYFIVLKLKRNRNTELPVWLVMLVLLPYVVSLADAMLSTEDNFLLRLADQLFSKWEKPCCLVMG